MSPTWETATDWNNAQSESGVVHESTANTDHNDATIVKQGYPMATPLYDNIAGLWPMHEDSGTTAYDLSGNNNDGTYNGATVPSTTAGVLGTSSPGFDGTDDYLNLGNPTVINAATLGNSFSVAFWVYPRSYSSNLASYITKGGADGNDFFTNSHPRRREYRTIPRHHRL